MFKALGRMFGLIRGSTTLRYFDGTANRVDYKIDSYGFKVKSSHEQAQYPRHQVWKYTNQKIIVLFL